MGFDHCRNIHNTEKYCKVGLAAFPFMFFTLPAGNIL